MKIKLGNILYQSLDFQQVNGIYNFQESKINCNVKVGSYEVAYINSKMRPQTSTSLVPLIEHDENDENMNGGHSSILIREGDLKLSLLKDKISKAGFEVLFSFLKSIF